MKQRHDLYMQHLELVLVAIAGLQEQHGKPATVRELGAYLGYSASGMQHRLNDLYALGRVVKLAGMRCYVLAPYTWRQLT